MKIFISDRDKNLQFSDMTFESERESFKSEITLKNKILDLKSDLKNPLLNYNLCISDKKLSIFWMFLRSTFMFRLTSDKKNFREISQTVFSN